MTIVTKTTVGFVCQSFDTETEKYTNQEFICGDDVTYEVDGETEHNGTPASELMEVEQRGDIFIEPYLPYDMMQPQDMEANLAHADFVQGGPVTTACLLQCGNTTDHASGVCDGCIPDSNLVTINVNDELQHAMSLVTDLATENALDRTTAGQNDLNDVYIDQQQALVNMSIMLDEVRRLRQKNRATQITSYERVIKELANSCEGSEDLLELALDGIRQEVKAEAGM